MRTEHRRPDRAIAGRNSQHSMPFTTTYGDGNQARIRYQNEMKSTKCVTGSVRWSGTGEKVATGKSPSYEGRPPISPPPHTTATPDRTNNKSKLHSDSPVSATDPTTFSLKTLEEIIKQARSTEPDDVGIFEYGLPGAPASGEIAAAASEKLCTCSNCTRGHLEAARWLLSEASIRSKRCLVNSRSPLLRAGK